MPIAREFKDLFSKDLPDRKIELEIELAPGTVPISKASYHMAPTELKELYEQLQKLLNKGFIHYGELQFYL